MAHHHHHNSRAVGYARRRDRSGGGLLPGLVLNTNPRVRAPYQPFWPATRSDRRATLIAALIAAAVWLPLPVYYACLFLFGDPS